MTEGAGGSENIQICMTSLMDDPFVLILADGYGTFQKCPNLAFWYIWALQILDASNPPMLGNNWKMETVTECKKNAF